MSIINVDKLIGDKRIAFLMAWDKRLGKDSIISKYIVKDVAKLIARKYITLKSQRIVKGNFEQSNHLFLEKRKKKYAIEIDDTLTHFKSFKLIHPLFTTPNIIQYKNVFIETPEMGITFDVKLDPIRTILNDKNESLKMNLRLFDINTKFEQWINSIDESIGVQSIHKFGHESIRNEISGKNTKTLEGLRENKLYSPTFKLGIPYNHYGYDGYDEYDEVIYPSTMGVKILNVDNNICYFPGKSNEKFSVRHGITNKYLVKGSCVKCVIKLVGVWIIDGKMSIQWNAEQILITKVNKSTLGCPTDD